jgi:hypothetical protein
MIFLPRKIELGTYVIAAIAAVFFGGDAMAEPTVRIVEKGVYRAETTTRTVTKEATGILNTVQNVRLISDNTLVYGKIGVRFGVRYVLSSSAPSLNLKFVIKFPSSGLRDSVTGARYVESVRALTIETGSMNYWEYCFDSDWEIVPGFWEFEFWADSKKLASQVFCVIDTSQPLDSAKNRECLPLVSRSSNDLFQRR